MYFFFTITIRCMVQGFGIQKMQQILLFQKKNKTLVSQSLQLLPFHSFVRSFIRLFARSFICSFIRSFQNDIMQICDQNVKHDKKIRRDKQRLCHTNHIRGFSHLLSTEKRAVMPGKLSAADDRLSKCSTYAF